MPTPATGVAGPESEIPAQSIHFAKAVELVRFRVSLARPKPSS